jgi:hypothetical protein
MAISPKKSDSYATQVLSLTKKPSDSPGVIDSSYETAELLEVTSVRCTYKLFKWLAAEVAGETYGHL